MLHFHSIHHQYIPHAFNTYQVIYFCCRSTHYFRRNQHYFEEIQNHDGTVFFNMQCYWWLYIIHNLVSNACLSYRIKIETKCLHPTVRFEMFHATDKAKRTAVNTRLHDKEKPVSLCIEIVHKIVAYMCTQYTYLRR